MEGRPIELTTSSLAGLLAAQLVLVPVHAVEGWIFWRWPADGRRRRLDAASMVLAVMGWVLAAVISAGASTAQGRIWPVILGSTAGYLTYTSLLLLAWVLLYGRR